MFCSICLLGSITPNVYLYITVFYRNFLRMAFFIYTIYFRCSRLSPQTCCVSCSSHTPFCSCFVQLALRAQTDTKHERQCAPHDGSLATVCGNSRGQRYGIENPKITYKKNCICEIIQNFKNIKQINNTM